MKGNLRIAVWSLIATGWCSVPPCAFAATAEEATSSYRTVLALIDELVQAGLISRERADVLISRARAGAPGEAASPPTSPDLLAAPAPVAVAPTDAASVPRAAEAARPASRLPAVPADLKIDWTRGAPSFSTRDGRFTFKPRGRILADFYTTGGSRFDERNLTTSSLRQFRFGALGSAGDHLFYQFEVDFRRNQTEVNNTFIGFRTRHGQVEADLRAGSLLTDRGIDVATAAQANPFIMLNVNSLALAPQNGIFLMGVAARASGPNWHASIAVHGDRVDGDYTRSDDRILMARAHWNPLVGKGMTLHVGGWAYDEAMPGRDAAQTVNVLMNGALSSNVRISASPLTGLDGARAFGAELGAFSGPFFLYGEYGQRHFRKGPMATFGRARIKALSVSGGWWITGETAPYQPRSGTFVVPKVNHPLMGDGGMGGLELVGRYERADLGDLPMGGAGRTLTLGLNWYMTDYFRLMANYAWWRTRNRIGFDAGQDSGNTLAMRAEVSF